MQPQRLRAVRFLAARPGGRALDDKAAGLVAPFAARALARHVAARPGRRAEVCFAAAADRLSPPGRLGGRALALVPTATV